MKRGGNRERGKMTEVLTLVRRIQIQTMKTSLLAVRRRLGNALAGGPLELGLLFFDGARCFSVFLLIKSTKTKARVQ